MLLWYACRLVEARLYKAKGRGFDSWWFNWKFSLTKSFRPHYGHGVISVSNRNEYQEYFPGSKGGRCVGLTTLPPSCADCLEIWELQPPGTLRASRSVMRLLYFCHYACSLLSKNRTIQIIYIISC